MWDVLSFGVGSGNNGNDRIHTAGQLRQGQTETIEMSIGTYETTLNLQLWKAYADEIEISIETPSGERLPTLSEKSDTQRYRAGETNLLIYYGKPGPFQVTQEIYFDFIPVGDISYQRNLEDSSAGKTNPGG